MSKRIYRVDSTGCSPKPATVEMLLALAEKNKRDIHLIQLQGEMVDGGAEKVSLVLSRFPEIRNNSVVIVSGCGLDGDRLTLYNTSGSLFGLSVSNIETWVSDPHVDLHTYTQYIYLNEDEGSRRAFVIFTPAVLFPPTMSLPPGIDVAVLLYWKLLSIGAFQAVEFPSDSLMGKMTYQLIAATLSDRRQQAVRDELQNAEARIAEIQTLYIQQQSLLRDATRRYNDLERLSVRVAEDMGELALKHPIVGNIEHVVMPSGLRYQRSQVKTVITTKPILLKLPGGKLPIGRFVVTIRWDNTEREQGVIIEAKSQSPSSAGDQAYFHPHISAHHIGCWGGLLSTVSNALLSIDILSMLDCLENLLEQYTPASRYRAVELIMKESFNVTILESEWMAPATTVVPEVAEEEPEVEISEAEEPIGIQIQWSE